MEAIETFAILAAAAASSFAVAFLLQWLLLRALFQVMPRRERTGTAAQACSINQLHPARSRAA